MYRIWYLIDVNGSKYEGYWLYSLRHGKGTEVFKDGSTFVGEYLNG